MKDTALLLKAILHSPFYGLSSAIPSSNHFFGSLIAIRIISNLSLMIEPLWSHRKRDPL